MANNITPNPSVPTQVVAEVKFPKFINNLGIIPTSYKDSMSYYECLAWLCKFLEETVIPTVNENGNAVQELQNLYNELNSYVTNYFENLDVQEEINNKLDKMVEDGTLQEIIASYLESKAIFGFDTINDMKASENLINGSYAHTLGASSLNDYEGNLYKIRNRTFEDEIDNVTIILMNNQNLVAELIKSNKIVEVNNLQSISSLSQLYDGLVIKTLGYHNPNDNGGAFYIIRKTIPSSYYETISSGIYAELIIPETLTPELFGAYGDGTHDDTISIQKALNLKRKVYFNNTYLISNQLTVDNGASIECNTSTGKIKASSNFSDTSMILIGHNDETPSNVLTLQNHNIDMKIILDMSSIANLIGVLISRSYRNKYDITVLNCAYIGVQTNYDNNQQSAENTYKITGINQRNSNLINTTLVVAGGSDDIYEEICGANFKKGVYSSGNLIFYDTIHLWITDQQLFSGSILFETEYGRSEINNLYCDGLETAIKINHICDRFDVKNCVINFRPLDKDLTVYPLNAHTTETTGFAKGSINYNSSIYYDILIDSTYYDAPFAGLKINAPNLVWKSDNGNTGKLFQTDNVTIGTATVPQTGLTSRDSHLPLNYNGYYLTATCKRGNNLCTQELNSQNGDNYFKTCVTSTVSNIDGHFESAKWYKLNSPS